jgi:hypothetical protein
MTAIPLVDLRAQHEEIAAEVEAGFGRVFEQTAFILGDDVAQFEGEFARFSAVRHCIAVANGTDALELALRALGIGRDDDVIVPTNSFVATALAVVRTGASVVLVDCDPTFHLIDPQAVNARMGPRTRAIIPVHLFGQVAPMEALTPLGADGSVVLIEDAAQAHGGTGGRPAGSGSPRAPASIPARISARTAMGARSSPIPTCWRTGSGRFATTAGPSSTSTGRSDSTRGSTPSRRSSCARSFGGSPPGTRRAGPRRGATMRSSPT